MNYKQSIRYKRSYDDGQMWWVAISPNRFPMWMKFHRWDDAVAWLRVQRYWKPA